MRTGVALVMAGSLASTAAVAGPESRGQNFPLRLPTPEVPIHTVLPASGGQDTAVKVWGTVGGDLVMLNQENRTLRAATSPNFGQNFNLPVVVAGTPLEGIVDWEFVGTSTGTLYVAYLAADPGGDVGLFLRRSTDMGRTWTAPRNLVTRGHLRHGILDLQMDANESGRVTVVFDETWEAGDVWAMTSSDGGDTWTAPVDLDLADLGDDWDARLGDVHVAPSGIVHVAFLQDRGAGDRVWYTRSNNGGTSFSAEVTFDALVPLSVRSDTPQITSARDGAVLLAFWDEAPAWTGFNGVFFLRSSSHGTSWVSVGELALERTNEPVPLRMQRSLYTGAQENGQVLVALGTSSGVEIWLSNDHGVGWDFGPIFGDGLGAFEVTSTPDGHWVVTWEGADKGIYASGSTSGGLTWGAPVRADQGPGAGAESLLGGVAVAGTDWILAAYTDRRDDEQRHYNVYVANTQLLPGDVLSFAGQERRDETDHENGNAILGESATMVTDGLVRAYVVAAVKTPGPYTQIWLARSEDGGRTFLPAVQVTSQEPTRFGADRPAVAVRPEGVVYVMWERTDHLNGGKTLMFSRSLDYGNTWSTPIGIRSSSIPFESFAVAPVGSTGVAVVWSETTEVYVISSSTGLPFGTPFPLSGNSIPYNVSPRLCVQGTRIVVAYEAANDISFSDIGPWARVSTNSGATWAPRTALRPQAATGSVAGLTLVCDGGTTAVAAWSDPRTGTWRAYASRLSGDTWSPDQALGGPPGEQWFPKLAHAGSNTWVTTFADQQTQVFTTRSADGGATWAVPQRLDDVAPQPLATRGNTLITSNGAGHVWVGWWDSSPGRFSTVLRHSADAGASWGELRRANTESPQGGDHSWGIELAALPESAVIAMGAHRTSSEWEVLVNTWSTVDLDGDGTPDTLDCSDDNPNTYPGAPEINDGQDNNCPGDAGSGLVDEVSGSFIHRTGSNATGQICWPAQVGATEYELARSTSPDMTGSCVTVATALKCHTDAVAPGPGETFYYLVRATASHVGSWGADAAGVERTGVCSLP